MAHADGARERSEAGRLETVRVCGVGRRTGTLQQHRLPLHAGGRVATEQVKRRVGRFTNEHTRLTQP
jgi:hypothetical protein